jgi:hypothetical protein
MCSKRASLEKKKERVLYCVAPDDYNDELISGPVFKAKIMYLYLWMPQYTGNKSCWLAPYID